MNKYTAVLDGNIWLSWYNNKYEHSHKHLKNYSTFAIRFWQSESAYG